MTNDNSLEKYKSIVLGVDEAAMDKFANVYVIGLRYWSVLRSVGWSVSHKKKRTVSLTSNAPIGALTYFLYTLSSSPFISRVCEQRVMLLM